MIMVMRERTSYEELLAQFEQTFDTPLSTYWDEQMGFNLPQFLTDAIDLSMGFGDWMVVNAVGLRYGQEASQLLSDVLVLHFLQVGKEYPLTPTVELLNTKVYTILGMTKPERK